MNGAARPEPGGEPSELDQLRNEIDEVGRRTERTVELGARAVVIVAAAMLLVASYLLPWIGSANGVDVLLGQGEGTGRASMVPRLFAAVSVTFGVFGSAIAVLTRRWLLAWACALGGWFASVDGLLAIWSRQSSAGPGASGPGIGLVIAEIATVLIAIQWFRTAWSRR
jgi:hypothetical protein